MLYDNALLAHAYLEAFQATGEPCYATVARETLDYVLREMTHPDGGFSPRSDADSEGEEGKFYVWSHGELIGVLADAGLAPDEATAVCTYWDVTAAGNWEGHAILHVAGHVPAPDVLDRARTALLAARSQRVRPGRDDKQLASWNGMALRAIAAVALVLGDRSHEEATRDLVRFLREHLLRDDDRVWRTARGGRSHTPGFAEDYANLADGLLAAYAALGSWEDLLLARRLVDRLVGDFWDKASGTLFDTANEHDRAVARPRSLLDNATPSANAVAADVMLRLALLTGEADYDRRARSILRAVQPALDRQPSAFGRFLSAADRALAEPIDVVIAGDPGSEEAMALRRSVAQPYAPDLVIAPVAEPPDGWPLFEGKATPIGAARAFVCRGYACDWPTTDPAEAREQVAALAVSRPGS